MKGKMIQKIRFEIAWRLPRWRENIQTWIAWRAPRWLVYWCSIRLMAYATQGEYSDQVVPDLTAMDALKRWEPPKASA
jgi:hypothetical protein